MTFDHEFSYSYPLFSSLLKRKREEEKENELAKIVIKSHAFQPDRLESQRLMLFYNYIGKDNLPKVKA